MNWKLFTALVSLAILAGIAQAGGLPKPQKDFAKMLREQLGPSPLDRLQDTTRRPVNPKALAALERLQKASYQKWQVRWDTTTGCAAGLSWGRFWGRGATRKHQATNLLNDYLDLFWQRDRQLRPPKPEFRVAAEPAGSVGFDMYSQGLKVFRAGFRVGFERDGSISGVGARMPILQEIAISPRLTPQDAAEVVRRSGKVPTYGRVPDSPELVIYPSRPPRLMYSVFVDAGPHLLVDANTGEIYPGMWEGPLDYRSAAGSTTRTATTAAVHQADHMRRPRDNRRPVSTSLDSAIAKFRRIDGRELRWREPPSTPLPQQSASPRHTGGRAPIPIVRRVTGEEATRADTAHARTTANSLISYYIDDIKITDSVDLDGDGYAGTAHLGVDIDLSPSGADAVVYLEIFGREPSSGSEIMVQSQQFPVFGIDEVYEQFLLEDFPHGHWDFRIKVYTYDGFLVASSTYGQFPAVTGVALETASEDAVFTAFGAYADQGLTDWNGNTFYCTVRLDWALMASAGAHSVWSDFYISDGTNEWPLPTTEPYSVTDTGHVWQGLLIAGKPHGHYHVRMVLWDAGTNEFLREFPYGELANWTNIPLETGREDKGPSQVFDPNPVNTLNNPCLWDNNDAASAVPSGAYQVVELDSLNEPPFDDGFYQLSGAYANIAEIRPPTVPPPWLPGSSYAYTRDQAGFEATMAYYHITANQQYVQSLNMGYSVCDRQVNVDVFGNPSDPDAAAEYVPDPLGSGYILFGLGGSGGSPGVDIAEDADEILHEYGHAILDNIAPGTFSEYDHNEEPLWMNEGFANYWAASSTYDVSLAHGFPPEYLGEWYIKNAPGCQPVYKTYGNVDNQWTTDSIHTPFEEHRCGQLWAGALWDILQASGKTVADGIIIDGHRRVWLAQMVDFTMRDVVPQLLAADTALYGADHSQQIIDIFAARGIDVSALCDCPHQGDVINDNFIDVFDVIQVIAIAFSGGSDFTDPACPTSRGDVNNDGAADVFDVIQIIAVAFSGGTVTNPCTP
jgi:hypothetical protein